MSDTPGSAAVLVVALFLAALTVGYTVTGAMLRESALGGPQRWLEELYDAAVRDVRASLRPSENRVGVRTVRIGNRRSVVR